jgi:Zn-dependent protease with chaperone function
VRFELGRDGRSTAEVTFYALVLLSFGLLVAFSAFVFYFVPIYDVCKPVWVNLLLRMSSLSVLLPGVLASSIVVVAGLTLLHQWRKTQRLLHAIALHWVPVPPRLARLAEEVGLAGRIDCVSGPITTPFCYGFIQPRVCVPLALLELLGDSELKAVLRHESHHVQRRDPLKIWLSRALARGLYFLPLAGDLRDSYMAAKEIAADEVTVQADGVALASALVKMLAVGVPRPEPAIPSLSPVGMPMAALGDVSLAGLISVTRESPNQTEARIRRLIDGRPIQLTLPSLSRVVLSAIIIATIFAVSFTNLSAATVMPVDYECVPGNLPDEPGTHLMIEWPVVAVEAGPGVSPSQFSCDLLIPSCPHADQSLSADYADYAD